MKRLLSNLIACTVDSTDSAAGKSIDFYFDDAQWTLRYLVCELADQKPRKSVLVPTSSFLQKEWDLSVFPVSLSKQQVEACPDADSDMPVSRQKTAGMQNWIPWPDAGGTPGVFLGQTDDSEVADRADPHLRSFQVVRRYGVETSRGKIGQVKDFVIDDHSWSVYGLVIRLGTWFDAKSVMVQPSWFQEIDWSNGVLWTDTHPVDWKEAPPFSRRRRPRLGW